MNNFFTNKVKVEDKTKIIYDVLTNNHFDKHIRNSIPKFYETQLKKINLICKLKDVESLLDIGGTTGSFIKTVTLNSDIKTLSIDINKNAETYFNFLKVKNCSYKNIDFYKFSKTNKKFDLINETMTFQFIDKNRDEHIKIIKNMLKEKGIVFIEEKVKKKYFILYEIINFFRKLKYFSFFENTDKLKLIKKMNKNILSDDELLKILTDNFDFVYRYYNSHNFVGYVCSNNYVVYSKIVRMLLIDKKV